MLRRQLMPLFFGEERRFQWTMAWRSVETKLLLDFWLTPVVLWQLLGSKFQGVAVLLHSSQDHLLVGAELLEKAFSSPAVNTPSSCKLFLVVSSAFLVRASDFTG